MPPGANFEVHVFRTRDDRWCARVEGLSPNRLYTPRRDYLEDVLRDVSRIAWLAYPSGAGVMPGLAAAPGAVRD